MNKWSIAYLFRAAEDGGVFPSFSLIHLALILFAAACFSLVYIHARSRKSREARKLQWILMGILLVDRAIMYSWFGASGAFTIHENLPLYTCRASIYIFLLYLITRKELLKTVAIYWGAAGAAIALSYPDIYPYTFPHYTNFSYVIFHVTLVSLALSIVWSENYSFSAKNFKKLGLFTLCYMLIMQGLNLAIDANYCYLIKPPLMQGLFGKIAFIPRTLIIMGGYQLIFLLFHAIARGCMRAGNKIKNR